MATPIDPAICPVCGQPNQCAMEIAKAKGNPVEECWCASMVFTPEILAKVPPQALNKACICKKCAAVD
jgi:hypothetical protein